MSSQLPQQTPAEIFRDQVTEGQTSVRAIMGPPRSRAAAPRELTLTERRERREQLENELLYDSGRLDVVSAEGLKRAAAKAIEVAQPFDDDHAYRLWELRAKLFRSHVRSQPDFNASTLTVPYPSNWPPGFKALFTRYALSQEPLSDAEYFVGFRNLFLPDRVSGTYVVPIWPAANRNQ